MLLKALQTLELGKWCWNDIISTRTLSFQTTCKCEGYGELYAQRGWEAKKSTWWLLKEGEPRPWQGRGMHFFFAAPCFKELIGSWLMFNLLFFLCSVNLFFWLDPYKMGYRVNSSVSPICLLQLVLMDPARQTFSMVSDRVPEFFFVFFFDKLLLKLIEIEHLSQAYDMFLL